jgi:hypothetical protein
VGFSFEGLVILKVRFAVGLASRPVDLWMGVLWMEYRLPAGLVVLSHGAVCDSS